MKCPQCNTELPNGATNCPNCGIRFAQSKRCPNCNSIIPSKATICPKCKARFSSAGPVRIQDAYGMAPAKKSLRLSKEAKTALKCVFACIAFFALGMYIGYRLGSSQGEGAKEPGASRLSVGCRRPAQDENYMAELYIY